MVDHLRNANVALLDNVANYHRNTLDYLIESLFWIHHESRDAGILCDVVPDDFIGAVDATLRFLNDPAFTAREAAESIQKCVANWRRDFDAGHPLAQLGRMLSGDPGEHLEYRGPHFLLTINDVLEGSTIEYLDNEWDVSTDNTVATLFVMLSCLPLSEIAVACYWAKRGTGSNLGVEIKRIFSSADRDAVRGQLANLSVAGQVLSWGYPVHFIEEGDSQTPEWTMGNPGRQFVVECTSYRLATKEVDDAKLIRESIARAWREKRGKFNGQPEPGIITTDISGLFFSREFGQYFDPRLRNIVEVPLPNRGMRSLGIYNLRSDFELLARESFNREPLAVLTSALNSREAHERNIRGMMTFQGQQILVDTLNRTMMLPKRGSLVWRGPIRDDEELRMLASLFQPATRSEQLPNGEPHVSYIHVV